MQFIVDSNPEKYVHTLLSLVRLFSIEQSGWQKKGDNNAKLIREKRFEISLSSSLIMFALDLRCAEPCFSNEALFIQSSTQTWRKSDTDVTLLTLNFFKKLLLLLCGFSKVNDAHISLIETLQMLQIRHFGTTWFCWSLGTKSFQPKFSQKDQKTLIH